MKNKIITIITLILLYYIIYKIDPFKQYQNNVVYSKKCVINKSRHSHYILYTKNIDNDSERQNLRARKELYDVVSLKDTLYISKWLPDWRDSLYKIEVIIHKYRNK